MGLQFGIAGFSGDVLELGGVGGLAEVPSGGLVGCEDVEFTGAPGNVKKSFICS